MLEKKNIWKIIELVIVFKRVIDKIFLRYELIIYTSLAVKEV